MQLGRDLCRSVPPRGYSRMGFGRFTGPFGMGPYCCVLFWVVGSPLLSLSATLSRPLVRDFFQFLQLMADLACDSRGILVCFDNITGCRKKCITILHQVGVSFDFFWWEVAYTKKRVNFQVEIITSS